MHKQFVLINPQINVTIACGIQPTGVVTMTMEVLNNICNMCIHDLPDLHVLSLQACSSWALAYISGKSLMPVLQLLHNGVYY